MKGGTSSAPSDWFIKRGESIQIPPAWGIILAPALVARPEVLAQTAEEFSYINAEGRTYTVKVNKDLAGNIISIIRTDPDGNEEDITNHCFTLVATRVVTLTINSTLFSTISLAFS